MHTHDIVVLGGSVGSLEALTALARRLPPGLPAALFVVVHFPADGESRLPAILSRSGPLPAHHARDGEPVRAGQIYVAPPGLHLLLRPGQVELSRAARENHSRPAIDPLFRTAARAYGRRVVGVVLSGTLLDGAAGLLAVRAGGGVAVVQDPAEALLGDMPENARRIAGADHVLPVAGIASLLERLACEPAGEGASTMTDPIEQMPELVNHDMTAQENGRRRGQLSVYTCPECGGAMWQVDDRELTRFRCHTGHSFYGPTLLAEQSEALEAALWTAVRTFKEKTVLARQLAAHERQRNNPRAAERFDEEANLAGRYGELIHQYLLRKPSAPTAAPPSAEPEGGR